MTALVTGASGMVGTALVAELRAAGQHVVALSRAEADLRDAGTAEAALRRHRPAVVYHLAGWVRGIMGHRAAPGEAFVENLLINTNVVEAARLAGVGKVVAMGSAVIYADGVALPAREEDAFSGRPHASEAGYAHAKRALLAQLESYRAQWGLPFAYAVSTNLYGPGDRFDEGAGHVVASLISRFHRAGGAPVTIWGSGRPTRDFMYVGDAARALRRMGEAGEGAINLASGRSVSIAELAGLVAEVAEHRGEVVWDRDKPDGQMRRAFDVSRLRALGVGEGRSLREGLAETFAWYGAHAAGVRR